MNWNANLENKHQRDTCYEILCIAAVLYDLRDKVKLGK